MADTRESSRADAAESLDSPGRALFQFVRFWSRRWAGGGTAVERERGRDVMVTEAVLARGEQGATINDIAAELGLDQSGASRMVAQAIAHGYLHKSPAADARQRLVQITEAGQVLITQAHRWQDATFANLTHDWSAAEVQTFTSLMQRLVSAQQEHTARQPASSDN